MTEQELTALAKQILRLEPLAHVPRDTYQAVAQGYLALLAERDALLAEREDLKEALGGALKECREHNGDYHWRTSDAVLDQWSTMLNMALKGR